MEFHLGTDDLLREVQVMLHSELDATNNGINLNFDIAKLFTNVELSTQYSCHTSDAPELAHQVADNLNSAFSKQ